jgi:hypothetical protein
MCVTGLGLGLGQRHVGDTFCVLLTEHEEVRLERNKVRVPAEGFPYHGVIRYDLTRVYRSRSRGILIKRVRLSAMATTCFEPYW